MNPKHAQRLAKLEAKLLAGHVAVQIAREKLIEDLGDHMCGGGSGPRPKDLRVFEHALRIEANLERELADLRTVLILESLSRPRGSKQPSFADLNVHLHKQ